MEELSSPWTTRFAPAPTGYLHIGHVVNAIHVWGIAGSHGGRVLLRIEDHDRTRSRPEYEAAILEDLEWLGFIPDTPSLGSLAAGVSPYRQSDNNERYMHALRSLEERQLVYCCDCTRREIAQIVGHQTNEDLRYPGTCRNASRDCTGINGRRVRFENEPQHFRDLRHGQLVQRPAEQCGDLLVRDRHAQWTYQFAVVVDDIAHGVDVIIRGDDLLSSTGRQIQLRRLLGEKREPVYYHHPLIRHPDGSKLSKSNRDTGVRELRAAGVAPEEVIGQAAYACGLVPVPAPLTASQVPAIFEAR